MNIKDYLDIKPTLWSFIFSFISVLSSGALLIFVIDRDLFLALDTFMLILISYALIFPIYAINLFCTSILTSNIKEIKENLSKSIAFWALVSVLSLAPIYALILCFVSVKSFTVLQFISWLLIIEFSVLVITGLQLRKKRTMSKIYHI